MLKKNREEIWQKLVCQEEKNVQYNNDYNNNIRSIIYFFIQWILLKNLSDLNKSLCRLTVFSMIYINCSQAFAQHAKFIYLSWRYIQKIEWYKETKENLHFLLACTAGAEEGTMYVKFKCLRHSWESQGHTARKCGVGGWEPLVKICQIINVQDLCCHPNPDFIQKHNLSFFNIRFLRVHIVHYNHEGRLQNINHIRCTVR